MILSRHIGPGMAAKKRGKAKARRKTQKKLNLVGVAESVIIANVVTEGLFNCNAYQFITGRGATAGFDGYMPYNTDSIITLPELLNFKYDRLQNSSGNTPQMVGFKSSGAGQVIKDNLKANMVPMAMGLIGVPIAFRVGAKLTTKPRATVNKMLDYTKIGVKV